MNYWNVWLDLVILFGVNLLNLCSRKLPGLFDIWEWKVRQIPGNLTLPTTSRIILSLLWLRFVYRIGKSNTCKSAWRPETNSTPGFSPNNVMFLYPYFLLLDSNIRRQQKPSNLCKAYTDKIKLFNWILTQRKIVFQRITPLAFHLSPSWPASEALWATRWEGWIGAH